MRKILLVLLLVLLVVSITFSKAIIVHWMHHSPKRAEIVLEMADEFMRQHPDIEVRVQTIPYSEYKTKLLAALAAGSGPDVAQIPSTAIKEFYNYGLIQPISEKFMTAEYLKENCIPAVIEPLIINNELYGFPTDTQTIVLFYNPVLFEKAGLDPEKPPQDWNELIEFAKKTTIWKEGKMVQSGWGIGGYHPVIETLMRQAGATFWDKNHEHVVYEPAQLEGLMLMIDAIKVHRVYTPEFGSRWTGFRQIKEAMVFGHGAMIGSFRVGGHPDLVFKTALPPANPRTGKRTTTLTSWALVLMSDCEYPEEASQWLAYISSLEAQKRWFQETGELPAYKSVINAPQFQEDELLKPVLDSLNYAVPTFSIGWADPAAMFREVAYNEILNNNADPEEALKKTINEINKYLDETFGIF